MSEEQQRYRVLERLAAGGMAEVFIGEALAVGGFKKKVAIKRVLPHLAENQKFIGMFLDEARLGARLHHANIVTVFDVGAAGGTYFIVMEFIEGCALEKVMEYAKEKLGGPVPVNEAVHIAVEACRGLSAAHEVLDDDGNDLDIIHRDVSPPNVLLSRRGEVKVTDFGLAKSISQLERTDPGVVKGKFSYLSPEAARGDEVDARTDLFAMGIVLWEMLSGKKLFKAETDYGTIKLVQEARVPSLREINPKVDADLEAIIKKALAKDVQDRYQSARELGDALMGYLFTHQRKVTASDVAKLVQNATGADFSYVGERARSTQKADAGNLQDLIQDELNRFASVEEEEDAQAPGTTATAVPAAKKRPSSGFIDTSGWADELGFDDAGFGEQRSSEPFGATEPLPSEPPPAAEAPEPAAAAAPAPTAAAAAVAAEAPASPPASKRSLGIAVAVGAMVVVGAVAYLVLGS